MRGVRACRPLLAGMLLLALGLVRPALAQPSESPANPAQGNQAPNRQVTVQNETDLALNFLYLFPPGATDRGPDRLGDAVVAPGSSFRARLGRQARCTFDVVAIWQDGREEARSAVNICRSPRLVFGDPTMPTLEAAIANRSPVLLRELYASTNGAEGWGPDRLGPEVIEPGGGFRLRIRTRDCVFDLRAIFADEREEVRSRLDLCAERGVAFDRSTIPQPVSRSLVLVNRHLATVQEVYVSSSTDADWGPERLGTTTLLPVGEEATVTLEGTCQADIRIVFPNGGAEERREVDLCATQRILLAPGWVLGAEQEATPAVPQATPAVPADPERPGDEPQATDPVAVKLRNGGEVPIIEIHFAPPGEPRGEDRLGADVLGVGEALELEAPDGDACIADLVALFRDGREVTRAGVDLCQGEEIEIR